MTTRVFECARDWDDELVTVFANNLDHAAAIYAKWVARHHTEQGRAPTTIYAYGEHRLEARPLLDAAASVNKHGVGYWDEQSRTWLVSDPEGPQLGMIGPLAGDVTYFQVECDEGDDAMVFAKSIVEASKLFDEWHCDRWGEPPTWFTIAARSRWVLIGELATLRDDMIAGVTGVAAGGIDDRWCILPPE